MQRDICKTTKYISSCLQLAVLLEVSANKPGNVNKTANFKSTRYEHFLASAVAVEPSFARAAQRGIMIYNEKIDLNEMGIGEIIKQSVVSINAWQHGNNTLLGTVLLLFPIAAAAGMTLAERDELSISRLRKNIKLVVESTTSLDAVAVYEAINIANPNGLVGKAPTLNVNDPHSKERILEENITLHDIFRISASYDSISREWVENYPLTFEAGLPYFTQQLKETNNLNTAIVQTFLKILSIVPDTLVARKVGLERAKEISEQANEVLISGGLATTLGREKLSGFDKKLRGSTNQYNPGTTADIISAVLAVSLLDGYRP
ncbi:MAG: triphosphoribosyl-dephospho-CoA synthase [Candidatus Bathyarchaeota archaeon]|nr:triphosphoribosyl-dephospho-CoA synthase [Candidatus Bathyarchaeota archaeon]